MLQSVVLVPVAGQESPVGNQQGPAVITFWAPNAPNVAVNDPFYITVAGMQPSKPLWANLPFTYGPPSTPTNPNPPTVTNTMTNLGVSSAAGALGFTGVAQAAGTIDQVRLGIDFGGFDYQNALFTLPTAPPVVVLIPSIATLATEALMRDLVSMVDFCGWSGTINGVQASGPPAVQCEYLDGGVDMKEPVGSGIALSLAAAQRILTYLGGVIVMRTPPWPDLRTATYIGTQPEVPWFLLSDGRACNAGLLAQTLVAPEQSLSDLIATLNSQFQQGALPAS